MSTQDLMAEESIHLRLAKVRKEVKDRFDAKPLNDSSYIMYHMIDQNIPNDGTTKDDILRIVQFFNTLSFFESVNEALRDAYLEHNSLRLGFLTNGALFRTEKVGNKLEVKERYNIHELAKLPSNEYDRILSEIDEQLKNLSASAIENDKIEEKWYFWPGCEMKIPEETTILVDTSVQKSKFVVTKKKIKSTNDQATQIILEEKPYQLEVSLLGDNEFFYKENEEAKEQKLKAGFFAINRSEPEFEGVNADGFSEIDLVLKNGEEYDFTLYMPYNSPRFDVLTHLEISGKNGRVEEFVATTT
ncbi:hypothetical protein AWE51_10615 [Aquimarina aggregata]|uniref:Uncharacterized protein n=1 Tax=Aquimarina aggregata TaxID=1642818 RepID=A0A162Y9S7_9FLAO|nr:hypothetical protein [Aquimarina aggregata]KZS39011.1 hypothetical protein AWE51_10615 [Aquimarina aggregata]